MHVQQLRILFMILLHIFQAGLLHQFLVLIIQRVLYAKSLFVLLALDSFQARRELRGGLPRSLHLKHLCLLLNQFIAIVSSYRLNLELLEFLMTWKGITKDRNEYIYLEGRS